MEVTGGQIINAKASLTKLAELQLPFKTSYKISKFFKVFAPEFDIIEKRRVDLIIKYGVQEENGNTTIDPTKMDKNKLYKYSKEFQELWTFKVEMQVEKPVLSLSDLDDVKDALISTNDISLLEPFIDFKD